MSAPTSGQRPTPYQLPVGDALIALAAHYVSQNGVEGVYHYLHEILGSSYKFSPDGVARWLQRQPGWPKRRERALKQHAELQESQPSLEPDDPQLRDLERRLKESTNAVSVLRRQLDEADAKKTVVESLNDVMRDEITAWEPRPLVLPKGMEDRFPVDACLALSDEHADEIVEGASTWGLERYNFDVFRIRLARWAKVSTSYITQHLPRYNVERLWVFKLGDSVHGNLHLAGQKYRNHFGNDLRAAIAAGEAEADAIARLLDHVPAVSVVSVPGNHPRQTPKKDYGDPHDNLDFLVTSIIRLRLKNYIDEGRLEVHAPRSFSAYVQVRGRTNALNHGDDVIGTWGIPWYGFSKHEARTQSLLRSKQAAVDFFWYGHFHTPLSKNENGARSFHNGAFPMTDDFALNKVKGANEPTQLMKIMDDPLGCILEIPLMVRDPKNEEAYWRGEYQPELGRQSTLTDLAWTDDLAQRGEFPLIKGGSK